MTKPKFQVRDKVRILDGSEIENYAHDWVSGMDKYIGCGGTITGVRFCKHCNCYVYHINGLLYDFDERGLELIKADTVDTANKSAGYWTEEDDNEEDARFRAIVEERAKGDSFIFSKLMYALIKNGVRPTVVKKSFFDPDVMRAGGIPDVLIKLVNAMGDKEYE